MLQISNTVSRPADEIEMSAVRSQETGINSLAMLKSGLLITPIPTLTLALIAVNFLTIYLAKEFYPIL
jgi:hypothetical protein